MRIAVFGANGPTGRHLTDQALAAGHEVVAVTRRPGSLSTRPGLAVAVADATDPVAVDAAIGGTDAVLSVLGARFSKETISTYSASATAITGAMARHGIKRLLAVSSSIADPHWRPTGAHFFNHVLDPLVNRRLGRTLHEDMRRMEAVIRRTDLDWTFVRPSGLFEHPVVTDYHTAEASADGVFTARTDLASSMLREVEERRYVRTAMGVITTAVKPNIAKLIWNEGVKKK
ncbi:NAD(P)H-binding protein [Streptomyces phaeochromogenes]|uniref:NAD(P)H-binding protein n=1 Tax=Streptomyces phaeochromogenes TaxID=1923 RepID=A0ABZ1H549_STRPH|nr:NAD(P)H-binding protein [Streptomyces phaeochromogenes]MCX5600015.1 NAD(P)H-binding protein [Streptomyces phaeochromogenes]WSD13314.1 NAD(P)H-binding protein [Streptomyces phaeochromogenes]WSJ09741.1 NAD(P)H-binding protein [Streptomyces phaeochromogenes]